MIKTVLIATLVLLSCRPQKTLQVPGDSGHHRSNYVLELSAVDPSEAIDEIMSVLGGRASVTMLHDGSLNPYLNDVETLDVYCTRITQEQLENVLLRLHSCHSILDLAVLEQ